MFGCGAQIKDCTHCGKQIHEGQSFCAECGAPVAGGSLAAQTPVEAASSSAAQQRSDDALQKLAALNAQALPPVKGSGKKILLVLLAVLVGAIAAVAGVAYLGNRVKQKASATLDNLESNPDAHKVTSTAGSGDSDKSNAGNQGNGKSHGDADNPLSAMLAKLQGGDGATTPAGNMAKSMLEDLGAKNPDMPPDLVRNMPWATLATPLPCPVGAQIDPAKLAVGRILFKPGTVLTDSWSLPLADAESDSVIRSVSRSSLIFQYNGIAALGLDMAFKAHVDFQNTVCAKDIAEGEAYSTGWEFKMSKDQPPVTPGLYPGDSRFYCPMLGSMS